ncbi:MAG: molybdate ABC transporter permease subunit, partial [Planctomycetota bacterium]
MIGRGPIARTGLATVALLAALLFALPLLGLLVRTPWGELPALLQQPAVLRAVGLSLVSSGSALLLAIGFGLPLAVWLASGHSPLRTVVRIVVTLP